MQGEGLFLALAQIGIIVASLAGVVASLRRDWGPSDRVRFQVLVVASLAIMFFALLAPIAFYITGDQTLSIRIASAGYLIYVVQVIIRRDIAFRRARTPLRTYVWTLVLLPIANVVVLALNVAVWASPGVHALAMLPGLYVATAHFRAFAIAASG